MNTETMYDFSMDSVPASWQSAADEAPEGDHGPLRKKRSMAVMPNGAKIDMTTALIAGLLVSTLTGVTWYLLETRYVTSTPWLGVVAAVFVALAVRLGGTSADREVRALLSSIFYMLTVMGTVYAIERAEFRAAYGSNPNLDEAEVAFIRDRLTDPEIVVSWVAGLVLCMQISYLTAKRRRHIVV